MKKFFLLLLCLVLLPACVLGESGPNVSITSQTRENENGSVSYPVFTCDDPELTDFLNDMITKPILSLAETVSEGETFQVSYEADVSQDNLLSVLAQKTTVSSEGEKNFSFFTATVDLLNRSVLTLEKLFDADENTVYSAVRAEIYDKLKQNVELLPQITDASSIPLFSGLFALQGDNLVLPYAKGTLAENALKLSISLSSLPPVITPVLPEPTPSPTATETPAPTPTPFIPTAVPKVPTPAPAPTLDPQFSLSPVITPTPMPLEASDEEIVTVLAHGLWKPLGEDGKTYYQFTQDGKLLVIQEESYTVQNGIISSESLNGTIDVGSDSAFTYTDLSGKSTGYVLNRKGEYVAPEEFVTPSPTPVATPTPTPSPSPTETPENAPTETPTATPTPAPTPSPSPTLSPYQQALTLTPYLSKDTNAVFERVRTLNVYTAPSSDAYRVKEANVTTADNVTIYGTEGDWVLVAYPIGNGSKGRIGYISNATLANPETVQKLQFSDVTLTLNKDAKATDDPLGAKTTLTTLHTGDQVKLLAFLDEDWAYVETTLKDKCCRAFIPRRCLED